jgi:hypothetical protein
MDNVCTTLVCQICKEVFTNEESLHKHIRVHKHRIVSYYQTYFPRYDLHDKKIIAFKTKDQYFNDDFNNKNNLRYWLRKQDKEIAKTYCKNLLERRIQKKQLKFAPCQVELRSLLIPSINYFDELFGSYYDLCEQIGVPAKYKKIELPKSPAINNSSIYIDTREQAPLCFNNLPIIKAALKFGDYTLDNKELCENSFIERKSLADFYGTMSGGLERFKKELKKAEEVGAGMLILVESDFNNVARFKYLRPAYSNVKASPEFVLRNMRELIYQFKDIQFLFVDGRTEAARIAEIVLTSKGLWKKADLQLLYDTNLL